MALINKYIHKNILGNWELFTYDISGYGFKVRRKKDIPYVSSNIGFKINEKCSCNHISNNGVENESSGGLEKNIRQNGERLTNARTKQ